MDFKDKKVLVFGSGISGIGACELLEKSGATVILFDGNEKLHEEAIRMKLPSASKAQILIGQISDEQLKELDLVVLSPGVPTELPVVEKMKAAGIRIWGEVELAYENAKGDVLDKSNILIDFKVLKRELKRVIDYLDHKDINELPEFKGVSPSSEILSQYIYNEMRKEFPQVSKVGVWENENSCSMYYEEWE